MTRIFTLLCLLLTAASCEVLEEDISGDKVDVIAPADGVEVTAGATQFRWRALDHAVQYEFTLVESSFAAVRRVVCDTLIQADTLGAARSYGCRVTLAAGTYQWRVTAYNAGYDSTPAVQTLFVAAPDPEPEPDDTPPAPAHKP